MNRYVSCTFWSSRVPPEEVPRAILSTLDLLVAHRFIEMKQRRRLSNPADIRSGKNSLYDSLIYLFHIFFFSFL